MARLTPDAISARLKMLKKVRQELDRWWRDTRADRDERLRFAHTGRLVDPKREEERERAKKYVNRNLLALKTALADIGLKPYFAVIAPPMLGGQVTTVDPLTSMLFQAVWASSPVPMVLDTIEQAIGAYESLRAGDGLFSLRETTTLDALQALVLGLRSGFKAPPKKELEVHDVAQTILTSHRIEHTRDKEVAVLGDRSYKPDFHLVEFDTPLEFKLCDAKKPPNDIQEQIAADVAAYLTRWNHAIFIVYDVNQIASEKRFCEALEKKWNGVTVRVVKH